MRVYEFWLKKTFREQAFESLCEGFCAVGDTSEPRKVDGEVSSAVYSISRNPNTHWIQLLVDDNTPEEVITAIEARINGLRDDEPFRTYEDDKDNDAPIETPKHFSLERMLRVRQRQKDKTLGRVEDVE